ncbi:AGR404Wp [Eremothecium gossypii ATCC 10895]|uniref:AGR404Wp n=1 Tax=Eremothecium gossypii (strain ATCC 10895 / CBS 109.51 / FGSC 9923 / NRRL Y-1056) TaxID=284811 RepID=Q74Z03_EREGS|nr:AGR404Wp [Eremothecium gossypii ATCC 10895]AAS54894.1 AGR404Wp [Eremothecium gossypii ATCC 10895]AEY99226.1 FAGR404Wp [Eremothecium gossypii FDAG1]
MPLALPITSPLLAEHFALVHQIFHCYRCSPASGWDIKIGSSCANLHSAPSRTTPQGPPLPLVLGSFLLCPAIMYLNTEYRLRRIGKFCGLTCRVSVHDYIMCRAISVPCWGGIVDQPFIQRTIPDVFVERKGLGYHLRPTGPGSKIKNSSCANKGSCYILSD